MKTKGYSLWLLLPKDIKQKYQVIISQLSNQYSFPVFEPHITLLGELEKEEQEVIKNAEQLISFIKPVVLKTGEVKTDDFFFRALYIHIEQNEELLKMRKTAETVFGIQSNQVYNPHMSLMYGELAQDLKEKIIKELGISQQAFTVNTIRLVKTQGSVTDWKTIAEFNL